MKRFFGSFARKPGTAPFDFFSDQSWLKLFRAQDRNSAFFTAKLLSDQLAPGKHSKSTTWHDAILAFDDKNRIAKSSSLIVPLVDAKRLAERGVTPTVSLPTELANLESNSRSDSKHSVIQNALAEYNLAIIATRSHIYLTTAEAIGLLEVPIEWTEIPNVVRISDGVLSRDSIDEQISDQLGRLETVPNWLNGSITTRWKLAPTDDMLLLIGGWRMTQVQSPSVTSLLYVDRYFVSRVSVVCFLFVACISWYLSRLGAHWSIGSILIAAATCVLLPNTVSHVGSMIFWGTMVGCLLHWSKRALAQYNDARRSNAHMEARTVVMSKSVMATSLLLVLTLCASQLRAEESSDASPIVEKVYVPIDSDGSRDAQNTKVYLSRSFYETLLEYEVRSNGLAAKWLLESSNYRASIDGDSDAETISVTAVYELRTLDADVTVELPIPLDAMRVLQRDSKLNRRPFRLKNEANADSVDVFFR